MVFFSSRTDFGVLGTGKGKALQNIDIYLGRLQLDIQHSLNMKILFLLIFTISSITGFSQNPTKEDAFLSISPMVNRDNAFDKEIIPTFN